MERSFWDERWRAGQIAFHQAQVNPHLVQHADALLLPGAGAAPAGRVLVPLCGKSHDLTWLRQRVPEVWGVEFVEQAARDFFAEQGTTPDESRTGQQLTLSRDGIHIVVGDFFALDPAQVGQFPALYDRAALVAVEPGRQRAYCQALRRLATPDAHLLLISFDHDLPAGPPFSIPAPALETLFQDLFTLIPLGQRDLLPEEPRFRQRGATRMDETVWLGQRPG